MNKKWSRREELLEALRGNGEVTVETLASRFRISPSTIRRDLDILEKEEIVLRTHGGVVLSQGFTVLVKLFDERKFMMVEEKKRIARRLCKDIPEQSSVILDNGTTSYYIAKLLNKRSGMRIATNSVKIAELLSASEKNDVLLAGGDYRARNFDCIGNKTTAFFRDMYFDYAILNPDMVVPGNGFFKMSCHSADVGQAMREAARKLFIAADHTKLTGMGNFRCAFYNEVEAFYLDRGASSEMLESLHKDSYKLILC